jgi:hypothetical protein
MPMSERADDLSCNSSRVTESANIEWARLPQFDASGTVLIGLVKAPEAERGRRPDSRSQVDIEIHGRDPQARTGAALAACGTLLQAIDELRTAAEELAPPEWRREHLYREGYRGLFLEGFEFHDDGTVRVLFDFDDLDLLILDLHPDGRRTATVES